MEHIPTTATAAASHTPDVAQALDRIDGLRADSPSPAYQRMLDGIADMIRETGDPRAVFDRVLEGLAAADALALARQQGLQLHRASKESTEDGTVTETVVFWPAHLAIVPRGQRATDTLTQLRTAVGERERDEQRARDFQASVAAGHVENVDAWHARTSKARP
ncbi:hypothetical protein ACFWR9_20795 [Streptomyces sp. NPDC058534]|uniref:hypothetical protein n=1 Tax=Streptomyces sp. NPDC058534 TaxID=3346541 RepID=UPI0036662465